MKRMGNKVPSYLVACNIYISTGHFNDSQWLLCLLKTAQNLCLGGDSRVVHAFSDVVYNRSSFHLAGSALSVAHVASSIACKALESRDQLFFIPSRTPHPYVGLIDHVSVMPLSTSDEQSCKAAGEVAKQVGSAMQSIGCHVLYYGYASPRHTSLAEVRKHETNFFTTHSNSADSDFSCVGAPHNFVENYNLRLRPKHGGDVKILARMLTKHVRERNGGLPGVEALTLQYGNSGCYEVACNILHPHLSSCEALHSRAIEWLSQNDPNSQVQLEGYRVGTTPEACLTSLEVDVAIHDAMVTQRLESYLMEPSHL